jgi:hypothetical protein
MFILMFCSPIIAFLLAMRYYLSSSVAESRSLEADAAKSSSPTTLSQKYTIPPGFHPEEFEEVWGCPFPGTEPQYFLRLHVAFGGLHYCFRTSKPFPLSFCVIILRDVESPDDDRDKKFSDFHGNWNVEFNSPRILATLHGSNITWNSMFDYFNFNDPKTISNLRSKLGLPPISPPPKSD